MSAEEEAGCKTNKITLVLGVQLPIITPKKGTVVVVVAVVVFCSK